MKITEIDPMREEELMRRHQLSRLCARVLAAHDLPQEDLDALFQPPVLCDPFTAQGMEEVAARIRTAKARQEKVMVCGDYDADGICATAIMVDALRRFGIECGFYIPNRFSEGYGLHAHTVELAAQRQYALLITVDNGVRAHEALQKAEELGIDVIVTDHHAIDEAQPPQCAALLHPFLMGEPFDTLSGAGVALEVSRALGTANERQIVLAGIAAIGDVMAMRKETRAIVRQCIAILNEKKVRCIQLLANDSSPWDETKIAFQVVPKLNVTGRLADKANANNTVRYLLSDNGALLMNMAAQISDLNTLRKTMSEQMSQTALEKADRSRAFLVICDPSFHEGIVGLVAGKLCEQLGKPCMVLAEKGAQCRGSIRAPKGMDLSTFFDGLDCLSEYGGHAQAAGIGFAMIDLPKVMRYVEQKMRETPLQEQPEQAAIAVSEDMLTLREVSSLDALRPFGNGFEEPLFCIAHPQIVDSRTLSNDKHMKWRTASGMELLYFNPGARMQELKNGDFDTFVGTIGINSFRGRRTVNVIVKDVVK